jgi:predicted acetyltransferase
MPQITVRPYEERDREAFFHVRAMTYNNGKPIPPEDQVFKTTRGYVGELDGKIVGVFSVLDFTCSRCHSVEASGFSSVRDAAVAGVAVLPEYRMSGVGSAMMREGLRLFREEGIPMASLYAFRESYYRQFGYEVCGSRIKISVPTGRFPKIKPQEEIMRLTKEQALSLRPCYEMFCKTRSGMNMRTEAHWSRVLGDDVTIYAVGGRPANAYVLVNHQWQFWEGQAIAEVVWNQGRAYESVLSILAGIGINKSSIEWYEPRDSPFLASYMDQGVKANIERLVMYRATDVPACLRALKPLSSGSFAVSVPDDLFPENAGPWRVDFSPDGVEVTRTDKADFEIPIRNFVQAYLGEPSFDDLCRNGVAVRPLAPSWEAFGEAARAASALMPSCPTYCTDFF